MTHTAHGGCTQRPVSVCVFVCVADLFITSDYSCLKIIQHACTAPDLFCLSIKINFPLPPQCRSHSRASDPLLPECSAVHHVAAFSIPDSNGMGAARRQFFIYITLWICKRTIWGDWMIWLYVCINISTAVGGIFKANVHIDQSSSEHLSPQEDDSQKREGRGAKGTHAHPTFSGRREGRKLNSAACIKLENCRKWIMLSIISAYWPRALPQAVRWSSGPSWTRVALPIGDAVESIAATCTVSCPR